MQSPRIGPNTTVSEGFTGDTAESTSRKTDDHSESSPSQPTSSVTTTGMNTPETSLSFPSDSPGNPSTTPFDNINLNSNTETPIPVSHLNSTTERSKRERFALWASREMTLSFSENASTTTTIPTTTAFDCKISCLSLTYIHYCRLLQAQGNQTAISRMQWRFAYLQLWSQWK